MKFLRNHWPILLAIGILWAAVAILLRLSLAQNQGHFVYATDDTYIHIAMARNFARFGVWGVTKYGFTSSTSSILWTLLLSAIYAVCGVHQSVPFILNIIFSTLACGAVYFILRQYAVSGGQSFLLLLAFIFLAAMPTLIFVGIEHAAQIFLDLAFVFLSARLLARESFAWSHRDSLLLLALAPFVSSVRYEGLFLISVVCTLLALRRRWLYSITLGLLALAPVCIYGLISVSHGGYWLPNSILLKGFLPAESLGDLLKHVMLKSIAAPHLLLLMMLALSLYYFRPNRARKFWEESQLLLVIFLGSAILHLVFAGVGWFYRYEAYLIALGVLIPGQLLCRIVPGWISSNRWREGSLALATATLAVLLVLTIFVLVRRAARALNETAQATTNIYQQQYQMAMFLREYYQGDVVAINDVGVINVLADIKSLDVWGLTSVDVTKAKLERTYGSTKVYEMGKSGNAKIAIVYDEWLDEYGGVPRQWIPAGQWWISNNVVCAFPRVSFYAVDPGEKTNLQKNLDAFSVRLPSGVVYAR